MPSIIKSRLGKLWANFSSLQAFHPVANTSFIEYVSCQALQQLSEHFWGLKVCFKCSAWTFEAALLIVSLPSRSSYKSERSSFRGNMCISASPISWWASWGQETPISLFSVFPGPSRWHGRCSINNQLTWGANQWFLVSKHFSMSQWKLIQPFMEIRKCVQWEPTHRSYLVTVLF